MFVLHPADAEPEAPDPEPTVPLVEQTPENQLSHTDEPGGYEQELLPSPSRSAQLPPPLRHRCSATAVDD